MASSTKEIIPLEKGWKDIIQMLGLLTEMMKNDFDQNKGRAFDNKQYMEVYNSVYNIILKIPPETIIYPGHHYGFSKYDTISFNIKNSAFFQCKNEDEFIEVMNKFEKNRKK